MGFVSKTCCLARDEDVDWFGVSAFGVDLVIYDVPYGLHVPCSDFGDVIPPWKEYNIWNWKWSFIFRTQILSDNDIFFVFCASNANQGKTWSSGCQSLDLRSLIT